MREHRLRSAATFAAAAVMVLWGSAAAGGEVVQDGGVRVAVAVRISPTLLPRRTPAPVAVSVSGRLSPLVPGALPKLETIAIAINSHAKLQTDGIPVCRLGRISPSTSAEALAACGSSLIGEGRFSADVKIPEQSPFPSAGKVLAFNGRLRGQSAIFAHIYGTAPVPTSYVLPFLVSHGAGTFGTTLTASLPNVTGEWGYVTGIGLDFRPRATVAACPAPADLSGAVFPLMKASFGFAGGLELDSTLTRSCKVRS